MFSWCSIEVAVKTKILPFIRRVINVLGIVVDFLVSVLADFNCVENSIIVEVLFLDVGLDVDLYTHFLEKLNDVDVDIPVEFPLVDVAIDVNFSGSLLL